MNHREIEEQITSYLLGDLESGAADAVKQHLHDCESCRALARELEPTLDLLRGALAAEVNVPERLDADRRRKIRRRRAPAPMLWIGAYARPLSYAAAAVVFLGALAAMVLRPAMQSAQYGSVSRKIDMAQADISDLDQPASGPADKNGLQTFDEFAARRDSAVERLEHRERLPAEQSVPRPDLYVEVEHGAGGSRLLSEVSSTKPNSEEEARMEKGIQVAWAASYDVESLIDQQADALELPMPALVEGVQAAERFGAELDGGIVNKEEIESARTGNEYAFFAGGEVALQENRPNLDVSAPSSKSVEADLSVSGGAAERNFLGTEFTELASSDRREDGAGVDSYIEPTEVADAAEEAGIDDVAMLRPSRQAMLTALSALSPESEEIVAGGALEDLGRGGRGRISDAPASGVLALNGIEDQGVDLAGESRQAGGYLYKRSGENLTPGQAGNAFILADAKDLAKKESELELINGYAKSEVDYSIELGQKVDAVSGDRISAGKPVSSDRSIAAEPEPFGLVSARDRLSEREEITKAPVFRAYGANPYMDAAESPFSTFSIDVDTASYTLSRKYMQGGLRPPPEAVRTEEFVNFFDYGYRAPKLQTFAVYAEGAPSPFGEGRLLKIGVKGRQLGREEQKQAVLTFVIDTSGSMDTPDRLGLVKSALRMLIDELDPSDRVAVVQVDSSARLVLDHTPAAEKDAIRSALDAVQCSGSTHLEDGIKLGYEVASRGFIGGAANRVLLLSDGAANLGSGNAEQILSQVAAHRIQGITCSVFGFGIGTYNDELLETLADRGDGSYQFIDSAEEARRVFVGDLAATLNVIAYDVKIQMEFNPDTVAQYRQIGYENRQLETEQFRDDRVDAGEVGSGQSVTALYEVQLRADAPGPIGTVRVRYRDAGTDEVEEIEQQIAASSVHDDFEATSLHFRLAASVAEFAEILRGSPFADGSRFEDVAVALRPVALELGIDERVQELMRMVNAADGLPQAGE